MVKRYRRLTQRVRDERTCALKSQPIIRLCRTSDGTMQREEVKWH